MSTLGGNSPLAFQLGGKPSIQRASYNALKQFVGIGGSGDDGTIVEAWRFAKARGIAADFADDRAAHQIWPDTVTDYIPVYEDMLSLVAGIGLSDEDRRQAIIEKMVTIVESVHDPLEDSLQSIDTRFSILQGIADNDVTTEHGRGFEDWDPTDSDACSEAYGNRKGTEWPNVSTDFICRIKFDIGVGLYGEVERKLVTRAESLSNAILPAWVDYWVTNGNSRGFILDEDLLDIGTFGEIVRGSHTGSDNVATLTDSTKSWTTDEFVDRYVYNLTDGSRGQVTANTATTITATLGSGTDDDWDNGDWYIIR